MKNEQVTAIQKAVRALIANKNSAKVNWTAANLVGNGLHVEGDEVELFVGCGGTMEDGWYFPTVTEVSAAIRKMSNYIQPDRTESGRGAFGRMGGSSRRSRYHAGHVRG